MAAEGRRRPPLATRSQLYFGLFVVATLNAFVGTAVRATESLGLAGAAVDLFGISAILWVALGGGLKILAEDETDAPPSRADLLIAIPVLLAALLPAATASSVALTAAALWAILASPAETAARRAGIVFLAMTGALLWGRLLLAMFSGPLLSLDALFVAGLVGADHSANMLWSADGATRLVVAPGCSSLQGLSLALVFWATINQYFRVRFDRTAIAHCLAALAVTLFVNVLRIGAMLRWPGHLDAIHHGWGMHVAMWTTLVLVVAICVHGARREIFRAL